MSASRTLCSDSQPQILLVLAGLPGSGKSTFAHALVETSGRRWTRASQDDARSKRRQEVEDTVRAGLARGDNVVVDRVDFNPESVGKERADSRQRAHFVSLAMEASPRPRIWCLVLTASDATLRARLAAREGHPTLTSADMALGVLQSMKRQWVPPSYGEGFERILSLRGDDQPARWDAGAVQAVLARLEQQSGEGFRGRGNGRGRGYRGRGYPRREPVWTARPPRGVGQERHWNSRQETGQQNGWGRPQPAPGLPRHREDEKSTMLS